MIARKRHSYKTLFVLVCTRIVKNVEYVNHITYNHHWRMEINAQRGINPATHSNDTDEKVL